jgi:hypothetical protein
MSFVVKKLRTAEEDILEAAIWYEERQVGLGEDFLDEVDRAVRALSDDGLHYGIRFANVRCKPLHRFKFYANRLTIPVNVKRISNRSRRHIWIRLGGHVPRVLVFCASRKRTSEPLTSDI